MNRNEVKSVPNSTCMRLAFQCSSDTFLDDESLVLHMSFRDKNTTFRLPNRQAVK